MAAALLLSQAAGLAAAKCTDVSGCTDGEGGTSLWCPGQRPDCVDRSKPQFLIIMFIAACSITAAIIAACFVLRRTAKGQAWLRSMALHGGLEIIVVTAIMINTVALAIQNPGNEFSNEFNDVLDGLDIVLTTTFTIEMLIKIGAFGLSEDTVRDYDAVYPNERVVRAPAERLRAALPSYINALPISAPHS